jgi:phosphatidylglycerophosphate synthase
MKCLLFRKLPPELDCPVDGFLLDIVDIVNPYFYILGLTPNILTLISALFGIFSSYCCYYNYHFFSSYLYFVGYFFDCADGNFARRYRMTSTFGDIFDHTKDNIVSFSLFGVLFYKYSLTPLTCFFIILFFVLFYFNNLYLNQQERYTSSEKSYFLSVFTLKSNISLKYLRYFGCGILNLYVSFVILFMGYKKYFI